MGALLYRTRLCHTIDNLCYFPRKDSTSIGGRYHFRSNRVPMSKEDRKKFVRLFFPGLVTAIIIYVFSTIFRDLRDNFIADMWIENGYGNHPSLFTKTETPVSVILLILMGSMILVKNNLKAFKFTHYIIIVGFLITGITSLLYMDTSLRPFGGWRLLD